MPSSRALGELKRMSSELINPEASTFAERIKAANETLVESIEEPDTGNRTQDHDDGESETETADEVAATAFALIDRFGGDIGSYTECCHKLVNPEAMTQTVMRVSIQVQGHVRESEEVRRCLEPSGNIPTEAVERCDHQGIQQDGRKGRVEKDQAIRNGRR